MTQITLTQFLELYEKQMIEEVLSVKIGAENRVYGRTINDTLLNAQHTKTVYAVIP